jgi:CRP-like cAMP-binding protein
MGQSIRSPRLFNLLSKGKILQFAKGQTIEASEDRAAIHMVAQGFVKRYRIANSGALGVQIIYGSQDIFSLTKVYKALLGQSLYDGPETYYYTAMSDVRLLTLSADRLMEAMKQDALLYQELFSEAGRHLKSCVHTIENVSIHSSYHRVAHQLLYFAREFGEATEEGERIALPFTQQDIADLLGMTRETVTMAIVKLRQQGLVTGGRQLVITSIEELANEAYT